jgi:hypothetical protein
MHAVTTTLLQTRNTECRARLAQGASSPIVELMTPQSSRMWYDPANVEGMNEAYGPTNTRIMATMAGKLGHCAVDPAHHASLRSHIPCDHHSCGHVCVWRCRFHGSGYCQRTLRAFPHALHGHPDLRSVSTQEEVRPAAHTGYTVHTNGKGSPGQDPVRIIAFRFDRGDLVHTTVGSGSKEHECHRALA